eukprot:TRINITY_DN2864_c0_g1_i2.p2 TRINITY_DN2864_c0_g1~~TRINITY_DN2864_c0_g1_i2.p2  ORF type:complete len:152 (+),score=37.01 TRINITY_DN2864_c0_g1_i2:612-1067(+)
MSGHDAYYVFVADNAACVMLFAEDELVHTITAPCVIRTMVAGTFTRNIINKPTAGSLAGAPLLPVVKPETVAATTNTNQVLFAGVDGCIYVMVNFELQRYATTTGHAISCLEKLSGSITGTDLDMVVAAGEFNAVRVFLDGQVRSKFRFTT